MKSLFAGLALISLVAAVGCNQSASETPKVTAKASDTQQQPVKTNPTVVKKPIVGEADKTFSLSVPFDSIELAQGGAEVGADRHQPRQGFPRAGCDQDDRPA